MKNSNSVKYIVILLWFSGTFFVALLIFSNGLLLHRSELSCKTSCIQDTFATCVTSNKINSQLKHCLQFYNYSLSDKQYCTTTNFRVIILLIDALRYDFVKYDHGIRKPLPYQNKLPIIEEILKLNPRKSKLFKFIADPPTTSMQRIKGLTTGSLPTFIDISSNFASSEINESNIIDLINQESKQVVFLGDDTWIKLYPNRFIRSFPFDSFNVWDLDTVDYGINKHLFSELKKTDWHLLIAHFLGVDHTGHRYGPYHVEMERKLMEMNNIIKKVITEITNNPDVLLFVIGDHGMTSTGDHGGETYNEITTALFMYSPIYELFSLSSVSSDYIKQVDFVPTLSSILGVSIPFSNIGSVVLECIPTKLSNNSFNIAFLLWRNIEQITKYIEEYSSKNVHFISSYQLESIKINYLGLKDIWINTNENNIENFIKEYYSFMKKVFRICQEAWVQFGLWSIVCGLIFMTLTIILSILITNSLSLVNLPSSRFLLILLLLCAGIFTGCKIFSLFFIINEIMTILILIESVSVSLMCWLCCQIYYNTLTIQKSVTQGLIFVFYIFICFGIFSNSFILEEPSVLLFMFVTSMIILACNSYNSNFIRSESSLCLNFLKQKCLFILCIVICIMYRIVFQYRRCREEHAYCQNDNKNLNQLNSYIFKLLFQTFIIGIWWRLKPFLCILNDKIQNVIFKYVLLILTLIYWICENIADISIEIPYLDRIPGILLLICILLMCTIFLSSNNEFHKSANLHIQKSVAKNKPVLGAFLYICLICYLISSILLGQPYLLPSVFLSSSLWLLTIFLSMLREKLKIYTYVPWSYVILWGLSSEYWFFVTGHNTTFSGISWNAAYLIQKEIGNNFVIPGLLVITSTFLSHVVHGILLPFLAIPFQEYKPIFSRLVFTDCTEINIREIPKINRTKLTHEIFLLILKYYIFYAIRLLGIMLCTTVHRRHLMMWMVFAPRLIFESVAFAVTIIFTFTIFLFIVK